MAASGFQWWMLWLGVLLDAGVSAGHLRFDRTLQGTGYHLRLHTHVKLPAGFDNCSVVLTETLPPSVYVDQYELQQAERFGQNFTAVFNEDIDLEMPAFMSPYHTVAFKATYQTASDADDIIFDVPVHMRYQMPSTDGQRYIEACIQSPEAAVVCDSQPLAMDVLPAQPVCAHIPTGQFTDAHFVKAVTLIVTWVGALVFMYNLHQKSAKLCEKQT